MKIFIKTISATLLFIFQICLSQASFEKDFGVYNPQKEKCTQELVMTVEKVYGLPIYAHTNQTVFLTADELEEKWNGEKKSFINKTKVDQVTENTIFAFRLRSLNGHYYAYVMDVETYSKCTLVKCLVQTVSLLPHWAQYIELDVVVIPKGSYIQGFYGTVNKQDRPSVRLDMLSWALRGMLDLYLDRPGGGQQLYICSCENVKVYKIGQLCEEQDYEVPVEVDYKRRLWPVPSYYFTSLAYKFPTLHEAINRYTGALFVPHSQKMLAPTQRYMNTAFCLSNLLVSYNELTLTNVLFRDTNTPLSSPFIKGVRNFLRIGFKKFR